MANTYTLEVMPTAGFEGILAVGVAAGVVFDVAVTPNTVAALSVQVVDTLAPVASIILDAITRRTTSSTRRRLAGRLR